MGRFIFNFLGASNKKKQFVVLVFGLLLSGVSCSQFQDFGQLDKNKEIYFFMIHPGKNFYFSRPSNTIDIICDELDNAQESILIALYQLNHPRIIQSLLTAKQREVEVKVVGDWDERNSYSYLLLEENNIPITAGNREGIQHNKFIIIDNSTLFTGTGNFTINGFLRSANEFVLIRNSSVIGRYHQEFEEMFSGKFGKKKNPDTNDQEVFDSIDFQKDEKYNLRQDKEITAYFFPQDKEKALAHILKVIGNAKHSIHYMIFSFSQEQIASALIQASHRIPVEGIHDSTFIKGNSQQAPRLWAAGFDENHRQREKGPKVFQEKNFYTVPGNPNSGGKMHCKTMLIDAGTKDAVILIGSFNWSRNAMEVNDENLLIVKDAEASQVLLEHYYLQKKTSLSPLQLNFQEGSFTKTMQDIVISEIGWAGSYTGRHKPTDMFIELYNRSSEPIDISHWTFDLQTLKDNGQFLFKGEHNSYYSSSNVIEPFSYQVFYFHKEGYFKTIEHAKYLNFSRLSLKNSAWLHLRLYDKYMQLSDEAILYAEHSGGYYDALERKTSSVERIGENNNTIKDGKLFTSWVSSRTKDLQYPEFMLHSAGKENLQSQINNSNFFKLPLATATSFSKYKIYLKANVESCNDNKISIATCLDCSFENIHSNGENFLQINNLHQNNFLPQFITFEQGACTLGNNFTSPKQDLRFFAFQNQKQATVQIEEIHYGTNSGEGDYLTLKILSEGTLSNLQIVSLTHEGYQPIYKLLSLYYQQGEILKIYLNNSLSNFNNSYDRQKNSERNLKFYSLQKRFSRQDEILLLYKGQKIVDMVFLSNQDDKMSDSVFNELKKLSRLPIWQFQTILENMKDLEVQKFALYSKLLKKTNSYFRVLNTGGWNFILKDI